MFIIVRTLFFAFFKFMAWHLRSHHFRQWFCRDVTPYIHSCLLTLPSELFRYLFGVAFPSPLVPHECPTTSQQKLLWAAMRHRWRKLNMDTFPKIHVSVVEGRLMGRCTLVARCKLYGRMQFPPGRTYAPRRGVHFLEIEKGAGALTGAKFKRKAPPFVCASLCESWTIIEKTVLLRGKIKPL